MIDNFKQNQEKTKISHGYARGMIDSAVESMFWGSLIFVFQQGQVKLIKKEETIVDEKLKHYCLNAGKNQGV